MKKIRYIGPASAAKMSAGVAIGLSLLYVPVILVAGVTGFAVPAMPFKQAALGIVGILLLCIWMPILYGIVGYIGGLVAAFIYNVLSGRLGGLEIELE